MNRLSTNRLSIYFIAACIFALGSTNLKASDDSDNDQQSTSNTEKPGGDAIAQLKDLDDQIKSKEDEIKAIQDQKTKIAADAKKQAEQAIKDETAKEAKEKKDDAIRMNELKTELNEAIKAAKGSPAAAAASSKSKTPSTKREGG